MQNILLYYAIPIKIIFSISQLVYGSEPPTPRLSPEVMSSLESRVSDLEKRVTALEGSCPCNCGPKCDCENCPAKAKAAKEPEAKPALPAKDIVTGKGTEILFFTADWCDPCKRAKAKLGDLYADPRIKEIDFDRSKALVNKYHVTSIPTAVYCLDGKEKSRAVGSDNAGSRLILSGWLDGTKEVVNRPRPTNQFVGHETRNMTHDDGDASDEQIRQHLVDAHGYSWSQVSGMNRSQLKAAHNRGHGGPAIVSKNYPVRRRTVRYGCPSCR